MNLKRAFTLVELLVVIAIIALLAAMLLPALSKAKNQAAKVTDLDNLKQIMVAVHLYTTDANDVLPPPNWDNGNGTIPGWLYTPGPSDTNIYPAGTGLLWGTLPKTKIYYCPLDDPALPTFTQRPQQLSSYAMNGAVIGYDFRNYPPAKLAVMKPADCAFWETDETHPEFFNDGANWPDEGVSSRHLQGGIQAAFDGSVSYIKLNLWYEDVAGTNKNRLWCYPGSADGGGPNGHNQ
ncbi:MAG: prepilin-type N-terminal cleavage/methylation domain-containing protein [Verrucomicrobiae bacterium]|nr:prepilin-type N-terminal cleavage/methylation domain-containing protein [Verrucomicrobiae bacterium]